MRFPLWIHGSYQISVPTGIALASNRDLLHRIERELHKLNLSESKVVANKVEFVLDWFPRQGSPLFFDWNRLMLAFVTHGEVRLDSVGDSLLVTYELNTTVMLGVFLLLGIAMASPVSVWIGLGGAFGLFTLFYVRAWSFFRNFLRKFLF